MCGIISYVSRPAMLEQTSGYDIAMVLMVALERLSYRGYDSSGIAVVSQGEINCWKKEGKLIELNKVVSSLNITGSVGIGHTRWATHGDPNDINAHPHLVSCPSDQEEKKLALVHNGIIENYAELKNKYLNKDHVIVSATDSEIVAHLLHQNWLETNDLITAGRKTFSKLEGSYAIASIFEEHEQELLVARQDSPLIIGIGEGENFVCSDLNVILFHTQKFLELDNGEMALVKPNEVKIFRIDTGEEVHKKIKSFSKSPDSQDKGEYPHYMLKEIFEQPTVCRNILEKYLQDEKINLFPLNEEESLSRSMIDFKDINRLLIQACGTSWHSGLIAKYWLEHYARILTEVDISSELRYRTLLSDKNDVVVAISQSGETADTLACIREAKARRLKVISFLNVEKSTMDRESDQVVFSQAGKEVGVASTKNYLAQLITLYLFSIYLGKEKGYLDENNIKEKIKELRKIPNFLEKILSQNEEIKKIADQFYTHSSFIFIGRGVNYPTALEGALKLKELSYLHATGYAAGELKHGPLALIDENLPVFCVVPQSSLYKKMISNIQEVKSRKGKIIAIASEDDSYIDEIADVVFKIPVVSEDLSPLLSMVPLQLFSYYLSVKLDNDVDQPKNLAKSVTVE